MSRGMGRVPVGRGAGRELKGVIAKKMAAPGTDKGKGERIGGIIIASSSEDEDEDEVKDKEEDDEEEEEEDEDEGQGKGKE